MNKKKAIAIIADEAIVTKIYHLRGQKVMLDSDLAELYQVEVKRLNEQVKRNMARFPDDFMFQLTSEEFESLKSQFATSSWGGRRKIPYAFTEQGVAMLSSVLNSDIAIQVNIRIIRLFTRLREMVMTNKDLLLRLEKVEKELARQGESIETVFYFLDKFIKYEERPKNKIGFRQKHEK